MMKMYESANIDWQSQKGSSIILSGLEHPWMSSIEPLLPHFNKLTGINVQVQKQSESEYVAEVPVKLGAGNPTPDVYMVWSYGQAANAGWLESLDQHLDNPNLFDKIKIGPMYSQVKTYKINWLEFKNEFNSFGNSYANTLSIWNEQFQNSWHLIAEQGYSTRFKRMWDYYFSYCEAGFITKATDVSHFLLKL